jgi:hypothetical protein
MCESNSRIKVATQFFEDLEHGKGKDVVLKHCVEGATFRCDVFPQKTIEEYAEFMKGIYDVIEDFRYDMISITSNEKQVVFVANMLGTHTKGGPVEPSNPPKKTEGMYVYIVDIGDDCKVTGMLKVFDIHSAFSKLGWPY